MPSSGNCSTATCRSRRWQSSSHRPMKPGPSRSQPPHDHASYQANCGVIGTIAKRSTAPSQSSPAAVWRCAGGAGLDGGEHGRSTITDAIRRAIRTQFHRSRRTNRCFNYITNLHQLDGRDPVRPFVKRGRKNDAADVSALCEVARGPEVKFVPVKSVEQQATLALQAARALLVKQQTMLSNALRGLAAEFGLILPQGFVKLEQLMGMVEAENQAILPEPAR